MMRAVIHAVKQSSAAYAAFSQAMQAVSRLDAVAGGPNSKLRAAVDRVAMDLSGSSSAAYVYVYELLLNEAVRWLSEGLSVEEVTARLEAM